MSAAFLASPVFATVDTERYNPGRILASMRRGEAYEAFHDGRMVGSATLFQPDPESTCETFRLLPSVGLVGVQPDCAGRGVGSALMDRLEAIAAADNTEIALSVTKRGASLISMYEARGYKKICEFRWPEAIDPSWIMVKRLAG